MKIKEVNLRESYGTKDVDVLIGEILVGSLVWDDLFEVYTFITRHDLTKSFSYQKFHSTQYFLDNFGKMFSELLSTMSHSINSFKVDEVFFYDKLRGVVATNEYTVFTHNVDKVSNHFESCMVLKNHSTNTTTINFGRHVSYIFSKFGFTTDEEYVNKLVDNKYFEIRWLNKISNGIIPIIYFIYGDDYIKEIDDKYFTRAYNSDKLTII